MSVAAATDRVVSEYLIEGLSGLAVELVLAVGALLKLALGPGEGCSTWAPFRSRRV